MNKADYKSGLLMALFVASASIIFTFYNSMSLYFFGALAFVAVYAFFYFQPLIALYGLVLFYPFLQWQVHFGSLNVPISDMIGAILFLVFVIQTLAKMIGKEWRFVKEDYPAWQYMVLFISIGLLSLINVQTGLLASIKFLIRPMAFFYLVYVLLPIHYIRKVHQLKNSMSIIFGLGTVLALGGVYMIMISNLPIQSRQALPFGYGSFYPLGANHNLLAEILVGTFTVGLAFFMAEKDILKRNIYLALAGLIAAVDFLTFSRAGWLGLIAATAVFVWLKYHKEIIKKYLKPAVLISLLMTIPIGLMLYLLSTSAIVQSSNMNRLKLADIALTLFKDHPLIGNGVGTYYTYVEQVRAYIIEYGAPLDAHGVLFKVLGEMGTLGVISFLLFIWVLFSGIYRNYREVEKNSDSIFVAGLISSACGMFVFELFNTSYYQGILWLFVGLSVAGLNILKRSEGDKGSRQ